MTDDLLDEATRLHYEVIRDDRDAEWRRLTAEHDLVPALIERVQQAEAERDSLRFELDGARAVARKDNEFLLSVRDATWAALDAARGKLDKVRDLADEAPSNLLDELRTLLAILDWKTGD